jgi:hypothetical protein
VIARVVKQPDGAWQVLDDTGQVLAKGLSNELAWRITDKLNQEAASTVESRRAYRWCRYVCGVK